MRYFSYFLACCLVIIPSPGAFSEEEIASPVEVLAYTDSSLGERLVYRVKEGFRESIGFRLSTSSEERVQVMINTVGTSDDSGEDFAIYSVIWLMEGYDEIQMYVYDILGAFSDDELDATAEGILAKTDELVSELHRALIEDDPLGELAPSLPTASSREPVEFEATDWESELAVATITYTKPAKSRRLIKGRHESYGVWIDDNDWKKSQTSFNPAAELQFIRDGGEAYAMVIAERIQAPLATLRDFSVQYIQNVDPDATVVKEEMRNVNGVDVLCIQVEAIINGIPITYYSYQYSGTAGSIQITTFSGQNLFEEYQESMTDFLNGFVLLQ